MISLLLRNLLFTILQPGVVAGLVPYLLLRNSGVEFCPGKWTISHYAGAILMALGLSITLACILRFATEGKGTISPIDPTKKLVARGLYRYSRNPMYIGVTILLIGESLFWRSLALSLYTAVVFAAFNIFIALHEEPRLRRVFGEEYEAYCRQVRRWL